MNRIICLCVVLLCSASFAFAQGVNQRRINTKKPVVKKKLDPQIAEAEKSWIPFWQNFREAIKNRDKEYLKTLIAEDYGEASDNELIDKREVFFMSGWDDIKKDFLGKTRLNGRYRLSKIEKIELDSGVQIVRYWDSEFGEWGTYSFYYMSNGKWYLKGFEPGCTA